MPDHTDPLSGFPAHIRAADVAEFLGVSVQLLADWRKAKIGPPFTKLTAGRNGAVRYPREGLRAYLAANTVNPQTTDPGRYCGECGTVGVDADHKCRTAVTA